MKKGEAKHHFAKMPRPEVVAYLESWCIACYDDETLKELREAAVENAVSEGGFHYASRYQ